MTSATSVPQRSKPPPNKRIHGLGSLVSANDIHLRPTRAQVSKIRPQGRSLGKHLEPWCPGLGNFPGALSWSTCPLSPGECPRHSLTTAGHLHPEISGPVPPGGSDTWGGGASKRPRGGKPADTTVQSPPPRRSPCSSIRKGIPLYGWKNRGEAPSRWLLSEPGLASFGPRLGTPHAHPGPSTTSLPRGNMPHP